MHQYPIKTSILRRPPRADFTVDPSPKYVQEVSGIDYDYISIISQTLNFSLVFIAPNTTSYEKPLMEYHNRTLINMIADGSIDHGTNDMFLYIPFQSIPKNLKERSTMIYYDNFVALVPARSGKSLHFNLNNPILCFAIFLYISIISTFTKIVRFNTNFWPFSHIVRIILGSAIPRVPTKTAERIVFFALLISSQQLAMVLFAEFTDNQISTGNTGLYKTLDDVKESDSVLVIDHVYIDITFGDNDSFLEFLRSRIETTDDYLNCPKRILRNENVICLTSESAALYSIKKNNRGVGSRGMEIMNHIFWSAPKGYFSSRGSLYVGEVNKILSRISEGRLWGRSWTCD
ncbi:hypothetical protein QAD02_010103 [Eretmocerus hayati]|uniref:Uncharacterized protein n=1 Tax=Eretmocerus hayati TaxID=131215 RepID=A0ACC2NB84_9HYME|nr:hypothetical protein QAD02_010103 [Eretmocerus hayati]